MELDTAESHYTFQCGFRLCSWDASIRRELILPLLGNWDTRREPHVLN